MRLTPVGRQSLLSIAGRAPMHGFPRRHLGLYEAFAYPWIGSLEWLRRMQLVVDELERIRRITGRERVSVLDFGGSSGYLALALRLWGADRHYEVTLADIDRAAIDEAIVAPPTIAKHVISDASGLPFEDDSVDVTVSGDVFEHIPRDRRPFWASEIARVTRLAQIHTIPCDDNAGRYASSIADSAFLAWHNLRFGSPDRWTTEHQQNGVPTIAEIHELFAGARVEGLMNTAVWLESIKVHFAGRIGSRLRFIARYMLRLRSIDSRPPFKSCLVVVTHTVAGRPLD